MTAIRCIVSSSSIIRFADIWSIWTLPGVPLIEHIGTIPGLYAEGPWARGPWWAIPPARGLPSMFEGRGLVTAICRVPAAGAALVGAMHQRVWAVRGLAPS